ncbi:MAG: hypothetical protein IPG16_02455 [Comamonadaceae bacterium]|jgi:hypothetical protein|nr:hypothetical protein [Comamonadaceae bacterium]
MWKIGVALLAAAMLISAVNSGPRAQALYAAQVVVALAGLVALLIAGGRALLARQRRSVEK